MSFLSIIEERKCYNWRTMDVGEKKKKKRKKDIYGERKIVKVEINI